MIYGYLFVLGYIVLLGIGTFLQKYSLRSLSAFQLEFLISIVMICTSTCALFIVQKNLSLPIKDLSLGLLVGILFVGGSFAFTLSLTRLPVGIATTLSLLYLIVTFSLSVIFLQESITLQKILGIIFMLLGAILLIFHL